MDVLSSGGFTGHDLSGTDASRMSRYASRERLSDMEGGARVTGEGFVFGSTVTHPDCARWAKQIEYEPWYSKEVIEDKLGAGSRVFATLLSEQDKILCITLEDA